MKLAIVYASVHHRNTEKLVKAVGENFPDALLIDASSVVLKNLEPYDTIGVASGIFYGKMHKSVIKFLTDNLPERKRFFGMYTSGKVHEDYGKDAEAIARERKCAYLGTYGCRGYDTFGPLMLLGGIQKGHPSAEEIYGAVEFVKRISDDER